MLVVDYTNQMKRDLRLMEKRGKSIKKLQGVVDLLQTETALEEKYRNHKLTGDYKNHWECHIEPDWLLIYRINGQTLFLVRTGSHSELF